MRAHGVMVALMALAAACGSSTPPPPPPAQTAATGEAAPSATPTQTPVATGPLLGTRIDDNQLVLVDPASGEVTDLGVEGLPTGTQVTAHGALARVEGDDDVEELIIVRPDGEVVDLGVPGVVLNASTYAGGGQRYLLASEEIPGAAVLIDLEAGTASTVADGAFSGAVSADERWAVVLTVDGLVLAPTDDAALATTLDESVVTLAVGPDDRAAWSVREGDAYDVHLGTITADGELNGEAVATTGSPGGLAWAGDMPLTADGGTVRNLEDGSAVVEIDGELTGFSALSERVLVARAQDASTHVLDVIAGTAEDLGGASLRRTSERWAAFARPEFGEEGTVTFVDLASGELQTVGDEGASLRPVEIEGDHAVLFDVVESDAAVVDLGDGGFADVGPARGVGLSRDGTQVHVNERPEDGSAEIVFSIGPADDPTDRTPLGEGIVIFEWL